MGPSKEPRHPATHTVVPSVFHTLGIFRADWSFSACVASRISSLESKTAAGPERRCSIALFCSSASAFAGVTMARPALMVDPIKWIDARL